MKNESRKINQNQNTNEDKFRRRNEGPKTHEEKIIRRKPKIKVGKEDEGQLLQKNSRERYDRKLFDDLSLTLCCIPQIRLVYGLPLSPIMRHAQKMSCYLQANLNSWAAYIVCPKIYKPFVALLASPIQDILIPVSYSWAASIASLTSHKNFISISWLLKEEAL